MRRFAFRLALALGKTVRQLLRELDAQELAEWMAFERLEGPLGLERGDVQAAQVACTIANVWRGKGRAHQLKEFLLRWEKRKPKTPKQWALLLQGIAAGLNASRPTPN